MAFGFSSSEQKSFVDPAQQPFLDFLRNQGQATAQGQLGQAGVGQLFGLGEQLSGAGQGFLQSLQGNQFLDQLGQQAGGNQQLVQQQIGQLGTDIGQFTREQLLPGIQSQAIGLGGGGGARQGVAEGQAIQGAQRAFAGGVTDIQTQDALRAQQAAIAGGGLQAQGALGGLGSLGGLFNLGLAPFQAQFAPLQAQAGLVGQPTVLSSGSTSGFDSGIGGSFDFTTLFAPPTGAA